MWGVFLLTFWHWGFCLGQKTWQISHTDPSSSFAWVCVYTYIWDEKTSSFSLSFFVSESTSLKAYIYNTNSQSSMHCPIYTEITEHVPVFCALKGFCSDIFEIAVLGRGKILCSCCSVLSGAYWKGSRGKVHTALETLQKPNLKDSSLKSKNMPNLLLLSLTEELYLPCLCHYGFYFVLSTRCMIDWRLSIWDTSESCLWSP